MKEFLLNSVKNNKRIVQNFSYLSILEIFVLVSPLVTYPYLSRVLGLELYGWVITAQVIAGYCSIIVDFGFKDVSARHISINLGNNKKISEIMSSILISSFLLWILSFILYIIFVLLIPGYKEHFLLFFYSFGLTLNVLLFPQFYFQGTERMKYITIIDISIQTIFIILIFVFVKDKDDYLFVPLFHTTGYVLGGIFSLYIIFVHDKVHFFFPKRNIIFYYVKDATPIFSTNVITTIKDRVNYLLLGYMVGMNQVVIYDVGSKLTMVAVKPIQVIGKVLFPKMSREHNNKTFVRMAQLMFLLSLFMVLILNVFLKYIVDLLIGQEVDLLPIRIYLLSPIFLAISMFVASNLFVARGYNKYLLYSISVTTIAYLSLLIFFYFCNNIVNSFFCFF